MKHVPNILTVLRIFLTFIFVGLFLQDSLSFKVVAFVIFVVASITDFLDGYIARKYNLISNFGKIMDPISDKFLTLSCFYIFVDAGFMDLWMFLIIALREVFVTVHRLCIIKDGQVVAAQWAGKVKTVLQIVAAIFILLFILAQEAYIDSWPNAVFSNGRIGIDVLVWVVLLLTTYSGWLYVRDNMIRRKA